MNHKSPSKVLKDITSGVGTLYLYGYIGQDEYWDESRKALAITDIDIVQKLKELSDEGATRCNVRINSPGGSIQHGDGIIAAFQNSSMEMHAYIDGVAASMAADIFLSFKKENRHMGKSSKLMIHAPMAGVFGNALALRTKADMLDKFAAAAVMGMANDTGMDEDEIQEKYYDGNDHWFTSKDAAEIGFIGSAEDYDSESIVDDPEKLGYPELVKMFQSPEKSESRIFKFFENLITKIGSNQPAEDNQIDDMKDIADIQKAVADGILDKDELLAALNDAGQTPTPEKKALEETEIKKMIEVALDPLMKENENLKQEVETLKAAPAVAPTVVAAPSEDYKGLSEAQIKAKKELDAMNENFVGKGPYAKFGE